MTNDDYKTAMAEIDKIGDWREVPEAAGKAADLRDKFLAGRGWITQGFFMQHPSLPDVRCFSRFYAAEKELERTQGNA
jgi:hypothetical protein